MAEQDKPVKQYSIRDIFANVAIFLLKYVIVFGALYGQQALADNTIFIGLEKFGYALLISAFLYISTMVIERRQRAEQDEKHKRQSTAIIESHTRKISELKQRNTQVSIIYSEAIGLTLDKIKDYRSTSAPIRREYYTEILYSIEQIIRSVLTEQNQGYAEDDTISACLLIVSGQSLTTVAYGNTPNNGHKEFNLKQFGDIPSAPKAATTQQIVYIPNTRDEANTKYFSDETMTKSIVSIPIINKKGKTFGVVNLDSHVENAFISNEFVEKHIASALKPLLYLLADDQFPAKLMPKKQDRRRHEIKG